MRKNFVNNWLGTVALVLLSIGSVEAGNAFVDLALYRPSTGQFFIRSSLNGSVTPIPFGGAPGDQGLLCRWNSNTTSGGDNLFLFRNGVWFHNVAADGTTADIPSFSYGDPTDQPVCGDFGTGLRSSPNGSVGVFRNGAWFVDGLTPSFHFGQAGDVAVNINVKGPLSGNASDRQTMVYGVYRAGTWFIDTLGFGAPTFTFNFGGLSQDVPLLLPGWNGDETYSLAIYRDGTWFIRPYPTGGSIVTVQFGAPGDIPLVRGAH
jgi:hypothetical protein